MSAPDFALVDIVAHVEGRIVHEAVRTEAVFVVVDDAVDGAAAGRLNNGWAVAALLEHVAPRRLKSCAELDDKECFNLD